MIKTVAEVTDRYTDLLMDVKQLYCFAYNTPTFGKGYGTWLRHRGAYAKAPQRLKNAAAQALAHNCPVPALAWTLMTQPPPICPGGRIPRHEASLLDHATEYGLVFPFLG
jgi:hypothetical protein